MSQEYSKPPVFAQKVYNDIFLAMNEKTVKPKLELSNDPKEIASRIPVDKSGKSVVVIGKGLIDMCRNFGKDSMNALAHILGHEMAHVFKHNNDIYRVGSGYASEELRKELKNFNDSLNFNVIERQADEFSAFYCHVAGYKTGYIGGIVLDSIYRRFNLTDAKLKKYPRLVERKEIVKSSDDKMKVLKLMFDEGNLALISGNYEAAQKFFGIIIDHNYKSREMWNNLGVAFLMDAIDELDTLDFPYLFPLSIDFHSYLEKSNERSLTNDTREKLETALLYFGYATQLSNDYAIGFMNKAITEFLLEDFVQMNRSLEIAEQFKDPNITYSVNILRAIHLDKTGNEKQATKMLFDISEYSELARRNYNIITEKMSVYSGSNSQINLTESLELSWPAPMYAKEHTEAGRELIQSLIDPSNTNSKVNLKFWNSEDFECMRWDVNKSIFEVWKKKKKVTIDEKDWSQYVLKCDRYYKFCNTEFAVFGSVVLKKDMESVMLFRVK